MIEQFSKEGIQQIEMLLYYLSAPFPITVQSVWQNI